MESQEKSSWRRVILFFISRGALTWLNQILKEKRSKSLEIKVWFVLKIKRGEWSQERKRQ
jgi:hypothetical protein